MKRELILQCLTKRTHAEVLGEMLAVDAVERVVLSVAFVSDSGVELIEKSLKPLAPKTTIFAGIRNDITSAQALCRLLDLGVNLYAVDTGSRMLVFHPKLYLVRGNKTVRICVGSANLTLGGLNNNFEAGVLLNLDPANVDDVAFLKETETLFDGLVAAQPKNVFSVGDKMLIDELLAAGRLVDEMAVPPPRPSTSAKTGSSDPTPRMRTMLPPIRRAPSPATKPRTAKAVPEDMGKAVGPTAGVDYELMWISKELERRDLNIPRGGRNTNATGSINLDKGLMETDIDHRHYFRDVVFANLKWPNKSAQVDTATATFSFIIKGVDHGTYELVVRHTTSTTSASYRQKNAMTRLSWGAAKALVQDRTLLHRRLALYRDRADATRFLLEFD